MIKKISIGIIIIVLLSVAYYAISPLFRNIEVHDEAPEPLNSQNTQPVSSGFEDLSEEKQKEMLDIISDINSVEAEPVEDDMPEQAKDPVVKTPEEGSPVIGTTGHLAEGSVRVIETIEGSVIRYENFSTINGPRLHVYLAKTLDAKDFIDLGPIKGTRGDINYSVPEGVDLSEYKYVMYWCVPFSVLFNYAEIR